MKSLIFIIRKTLKNIIKGVFKKPLKLIGYIFVILFIGLLIFTSFAMPSEGVRSASPELFQGIVALVFLFMYYTYLSMGIDKGSTYFRMADVSLTFTAPIKPNKILVYAFIKQMGSTLLFLFIAICQIPNLKNNFAMHPYGALMILIAAVVFALSYPLLNMILYSWATKKTNRKRLVKRIFNISALAIAAFAVLNLAITRDIVKTLQIVFNNPISKFFPVIGWTASIANAAVAGITIEFWFGLIAMILLVVGISIALYRMNLDYYEDVLEGAEFVEAAVKAKRSGNNMRFNLKVKQGVKQKISGSGAISIFYKHLLEIRKTSFFLFFDRGSITVIISSIIFKLVMPNEVGSTLTLAIILAFSLYMLLIIQAQGSLNTELDKHFIFLIPESSSKKLFYTTLAEHIKNLIDGSILFIITGIMFKAPISVIIVCALTYTIFGAVFTYTDVLSMRIFGGVHSKGVLVFLKVMANFLIFIPGIIAAVVVGIFTTSELLAICALGGWSLILAVTLFMLSAGILNNLESAG